MSVCAIYNPVCGNGDARSFFDQHVLPLLAQHGKILGAYLATDHAGHAGQLLVDFLDSGKGSGDVVTVVLGSGDGTLHEIVNHLFSVNRAGPGANTPTLGLDFVLVPCGTANALYSSLFPPTPGEDGVEYRLQSVYSFLRSSRAIPLALTITTISSPPSEKKLAQLVMSLVVASSALHASILYDSENMRSMIPGLDRFKIAAQNNGAKWYNSHVRLFPTPVVGRVQVYDPDIQAFIDHPESNHLAPIVNVDGPFVYFLSTINVDRLEPTFRIAPLIRTVPPLGAACDIVLLRPLRDPSSVDSSNATKTSFAPKLWAVLDAAYKDGAHVNLRYDLSGQITSTGNGPTVVEYIRCGGWEWVPEETDEDAHLFCSDGAIFHINKGGRATCSIGTPSVNSGIAVHVY